MAPDQSVIYPYLPANDLTSRGGYWRTVLRVLCEKWKIMPGPFKRKSFLDFHKKILVSNSLFISSINGPDSSPYPSGLRYMLITICVNTLKVSISRMYIL